MENIEKQALQTYQNNLNYFKQHHIKLYNKIQLLSSLIGVQEYQEKYSLEYNNEGYFDVKEIETQSWLYGENSIHYSKAIVTTVNKKRTGGVFHAQKFVDFSPEMVDIVDTSKLDFHNALWATIKIIDYTRRYAPKNSTSMMQVYKNIFINIGLGIHLKTICEKLESSIIYIYEQNLELFRLALFVTDFTELANSRTLFFSIGDTEKEGQESFINFLNTGNNYNLNIKHIPFTKNYELILQRFQRYVLSQNYIMYGYSGLLLRAIDSLKYLPKGYNFINVNKTYFNSVFSNKPTLLFFSGPSANHNIDWLVENRKKFILVTALSTCRLLNKYHLEPDIVVHIDPGKEQTLKLFEDINTPIFFKNTIAIFSSNVDEKTVKKFNKKHIFFIEQGTNYKKGFGNFTAPSVGEYSYAIFLLFGIQTMFLLGLDLALDPTTLKTHGDFHPFQEQGEVNNEASLSYETSIVTTQGNFLNQIPTLPLYQISINEFERFTHMVKRQEQLVYNLSNGARLFDTIPQAIRTYNWANLPNLKREKVFKHLLFFFQEASSSDFRSEDKNLIIYQYNEAKKLEKMIQEFANLSFIDVDSYLKALSSLSYNLSDMEKQTKSDLADVYYEYFQIILSYIFDLFNTAELDNPSERLLEINTILIKQLLKISNIYIDVFEKYI